MAPPTASSTRSTPRSASAAVHSAREDTARAAMSTSTKSSMPNATKSVAVPSTTPEWRGRAPLSPLSTSNAASSPAATTSTSSSPWSSTPVQESSFIPFASASCLSSSSSKHAHPSSSSRISSHPSLPRTSKLTSSISPKQSLSAHLPQQHSTTSPRQQQRPPTSASHLSPQHISQRGYSAATTPTGNEISPPRASFETIQRRLYEEAHEQQFLGPNASVASAATVLVLHALQSPAKIGSSPAKGKGISSIFPPSPDGVALPSLPTSMVRSRQQARSRARSRSIHSQTGANQVEIEEEDEDTDVSPAPPPLRRRSLKDRENDEMHNTISPSEGMLSATHLSSRLPKKRFDLSDWQLDLAAIASSASPADAKTPTSRSFPSSLNEAQAVEASPAPTLQAAASCMDLKAPQFTSQQYRVGMQGFTGRDPFKLKDASLQDTLPSSPITESSKVVSTAAAQRPQHREATARPPLQYRPNQPQLQASFGQVGSASLFGTPLVGEASTISPFASTSRRSTRALVSRPGAVGQHHRTHSRTKSAEHDAKILRASTDRPSLPNTVEHISSSFDACASAIRHRQRTKSISESEDNHSDSEDDANANLSLSLPESPDLAIGSSATESRDGYIEAGIFSGMTVNDCSISRGSGVPSIVQTSTDEMQIDEEGPDALQIPSSTIQHELDDSDDSLFLDTPGRSRGSSMPSGSGGAQSSYTLNASLPFPPQLKPSRVSYPPKILYTNRANEEDTDTHRAKNPLHSSVPASTKGSSSTGASRPLDQLFLASILNGTTPLPSASMSVKRQPSMSLSKSAGTSLIRNPSDPSKLGKGLQPLSPNASHIGRKRNAHGAMIAGSGSSSREASNTSLAGKLGSSVNPTASVDAVAGRPSIDGSTDEEAGLSPTLPPLTDSSSATSSLASSQRSGQFSKLSQRDNAGKPQTVSEHEREHPDPLDDLSFLSDSTVPSFLEDSRLPRTVSTNRALSDTSSKLPKASGQLKSPGTPGLSSGIPRRTSPHFRNVRPLQAAFMNSGLLSKKSVRSRLDRDSGIGLGATPPAPALRRLLHQGRRENSSMHSTPGSQPSLSFSTPSHYSTSFSSSQLDSPVPTVEIAPSNSMDAEALVNTSLGSQSRRMPDTPCKKPPLYAHVRQPATTLESAKGQDGQAASHGLHPLAQCSRPTTGRSTSSCSSTMSDSSSVVNSIPGSAVKLKERPAMSPYALGSNGSHKYSRNSADSGSPSSAGSPCAVQDVPQKSAIPRRRVGPALFRRRSSGQIQTGADGSFMALSERSGGSTRSGLVDWEPMTPTRSYAEQEWLALPTLAASPKSQAVSMRPFLTTEIAPVEASMVSPTSPLAQSPLAVQSVRFGDVRALPSSLPRPGMPQVKHLQRPAFRARHSSSVVHTARQSELLSPDRFSTVFSINRMLGQGEFSEAFEVRDRNTDEIYAVKKTKVPLAGHKARLRRLEEVDILRLLSKGASPSPFIIRLSDAWEQAGNLYIQTELCPFGNLAFFLEEYGRMYEFLDEARVWKILAEITSGVAYIHQHGVLHLDLKPANVFISSNGSLKIGDFGLATRWPRVKPISILQGAAVHSPGWDAAAASNVWLSERARSKSSDEQQDSCGTMQDLEREGDREYIAPEILRGQYGRPADMFALGLLILEAAANVVLPDNGLPWRKLREDDLSDVAVGHLSDELVYVIVNLLRSEPSKRTSIDELQAHPVVNKMQQLRQNGFKLEASSCNGELDVPVATKSEQLDHLVSHARGAIVEEASDFLPRVMAEVRRIWHSPRKAKIERACHVTTLEQAGQMDIDC